MNSATPISDTTPTSVPTTATGRQLRVWWVPQIPGKAFRYPVETLVQAKTLLDCLAQYDKFLLDNNHRVNYANTGGLEVWDEEEQDWLDWCDSVYYESIDAFELDQLQVIDQAPPGVVLTKDSYKPNLD
jgi:Superinfection exclusion gene product 17